MNEFVKSCLAFVLLALLGYFVGSFTSRVYKHKTLMDSLTIEKLKLEIELKKLHLNKQ